MPSATVCTTGEHSTAATRCWCHFWSHLGIITSYNNAGSCGINGFLHKAQVFIISLHTLVSMVKKLLLR